MATLTELQTASVLIHSFSITVTRNKRNGDHLCDEFPMQTQNLKQHKIKTKASKIAHTKTKSMKKTVIGAIHYIFSMQNTKSWN